QPPPPDKPPPPQQKDRVQPRDSQVDQPKVVIPVSDRTETTFDDVKLPPLPDQGSIGTGTETIPTPVPDADPVRIVARFVTPERLIKPPYPADKVRLEEEAVLRLKLSIDDRGRVVSVEPVGRVDRSFFEAARRHLIANWRYKPATEGGRAVASTTVISLTFRLE
ncbi:MAG TPA: energy transducer TonB, partial [Sphingomicrobium sp.]